MSTKPNNLQNWTLWEGILLDGKYPLERFISANGDNARFATRNDSTGPSAIASVISWNDENAAGPLAIWKELEQSGHSNLLRILNARKTTVNDVSTIYAVMEQPDENLGAVLEERPLSPEEASQVLENLLPALEFLNQHNWVHTNITPAEIGAVGESIKLTSDSLRMTGTPAEPDGSTRYPAPELAESGYTSASSIWSLGASLFEILTATRWTSEADKTTLHGPLAAIIEGCLAPDPSARWTTARIRSRLNGAVAPEAPTAQPIAPIETAKPSAATFEPSFTLSGRPLRQRPEEEPTRRNPILLYCGALLVVLFFGWLLFRPASKQVPSPAQQADSPESFKTHTAAAAPDEDSSTPDTAAPAASQPIAVTPPAKHNKDGAVWRVIAYTYSREQDARKKVESINRTKPSLHAEVFSPKSGSGPYLVTIGGAVTREEAQEMRRKALSLGMPRDTYTQNY